MFLQSLEVTLALPLEDRTSHRLQRRRRDCGGPLHAAVLHLCALCPSPYPVQSPVSGGAPPPPGPESGALSPGPRERKTWGHQWQAPKPLALPSLIQVATCPRWVECHVLRADWKGRMWLLLSACCLPSLSRLEASAEDKIS